MSRPEIIEHIANSIATDDPVSLYGSTTQEVLDYVEKLECELAEARKALAATNELLIVVDTGAQPDFQNQNWYDARDYALTTHRSAIDAAKGTK